jgi:hypothetical protein
MRLRARRVVARWTRDSQLLPHASACLPGGPEVAIRLRRPSKRGDRCANRHVQRAGWITGCGRTKEEGIPWQRHIFPKSCPFSIVCAGVFHYRVRDGNGWFRPAQVTKRFPVPDSIHGLRRSCNTVQLSDVVAGGYSRASGPCLRLRTAGVRRRMRARPPGEPPKRG